MSALAAKLEHDGVTYDAEIAIVESTMLGSEDHGIWTANLHLTGISRGWGQSAGGYALDAASDGNDRHGTAFGLDQVIAIVRTIGCADWEHVTGSRLLVLRESNRHGRIVGIADLSGERVLIFERHAESWRGSNGEIA